MGFLAACTPVPQQDGSAPPDTSVAATVFVNPTFACPSPRIVEPGAGYPYPVVFPADTSGAEASVADITRFCEETLALFAEPNLTAAEAEQIYALLEDELSLSDESYGMPSPDEPASQPIEVRERVMLRKTAPATYAVFYTRSGCGLTYHHQRLTKQADGTVQITPLETWREKYPC
jgi:hypothetical protein